MPSMFLMSAHRCKHTYTYIYNFSYAGVHKVHRLQLGPIAHGKSTNKGFRWHQLWCQPALHQHSTVGGRFQAKPWDAFSTQAELSSELAATAGSRCQKLTWTRKAFCLIHLHRNTLVSPVQGSKGHHSWCHSPMSIPREAEGGQSQCRLQPWCCKVTLHEWSHLWKELLLQAILSKASVLPIFGVFLRVHEQRTTEMW